MELRVTLPTRRHSSFKCSSAVGVIKGMRRRTCIRHVQWHACEEVRAVWTRSWVNECRIRPGRAAGALQCTADGNGCGMAREWHMMCADSGRSDGAPDAWNGDVREARSAEACWHTSIEQHCVDDCCDARSVVADVQGHERDIEGRVETRARGLRGSTAGRELMAVGGTGRTKVQGGHMSHISWSGNQECNARDHVTMSG